jgi:hypothetical protein
LYWLLQSPYHIDDADDPLGVFKDKKGAYVIDPANSEHIYELPEVSPKGKLIETIVRGIRDKIGGSADHVQDLARLLRLPGSLNRKNERNGQVPRPCRLVDCEPERRYPLSLFESFAVTSESLHIVQDTIDTPAAVFEKEADQEAGEPLPHLKAEFEKLLRECESPRDDDRSAADFSLCCRCIEKGVGKAWAWQKLQSIGKTAERGAAYFEQTWTKAEAKVKASRSRVPDGNASPEEQRGTNLPPHTLGEFTLRPENPRETEGGKVVLTISIFSSNGDRLDRLTISDAASGRDRAGKYLKRNAPGTDPDAILGKMLSEAAEAIHRQRAAGNNRPTIAAVLAEKVPPRFAFAFRSERGAYSQIKSAELSVVDFANYCPPWLLGDCMKASDCPRRQDGTVNRLSLFKIMKHEMASLFSQITDTLPRENEANYGPDSPAASRFRRKLIEVLTYPTTFEVDRRSLGTPAEHPHAAKTNIVERIRDDSQVWLQGYWQQQLQSAPSTKPPPKIGWVQVQKAYDVWWRPMPRRQGMKPRVIIALRYRIAFQTQAAKSLPGVYDQESFRRQCVRSGIAGNYPKVSNRLRSGDRLVLLAQNFIRELMAQPFDLIDDRRIVSPKGRMTP